MTVQALLTLLLVIVAFDTANGISKLGQLKTQRDNNGHSTVNVEDGLLREIYENAIRNSINKFR